MSRRHVKPKPAKHYTLTEKIAMRRVKRKNGPSALRRRERRIPLQRADAAKEQL